MKTGLSEPVWKELKEAFGQFPKIRKVILYGSRSLGTFREGSDIDLAVIGDELNLEDMLDISATMEDLGMLYTFDLCNYHKIQNPELRSHIDRVGIPVFEKDETKT